MRGDLYQLSERMYVPIEQVAIPTDITIFGTHFGENTYYADYAGIGRRYAPKRVLEIGVRFGYSGIAITSGALAGGARPPVQYVGLDAEFFAGNTNDERYSNYRSNAIAAENFRRYRPGVEATFYTCDTRNGLPDEILIQQFDLINVDGDHSYEGAFGDMNRVWSLLASGGIMIVDDTGMEGVRRAVEQFRNEHAGELEGFQWHSNERGFAIFKKKPPVVAAPQKQPVEPPSRPTRKSPRS